MDLRNLNTFIQVAESGSFTRASKKLGYSQPTISVQIKQLESELGIKLFDLTGLTIVKGYGGFVMGPATVNIFDGTNPYTITGHVRIIDGAYTFSPDYYQTGSTYRTFTGITKISIPTVSFTSLMPY